MRPAHRAWTGLQKVRAFWKPRACSFDLHKQPCKTAFAVKGWSLEGGDGAGDASAQQDPSPSAGSAEGEHSQHEGAFERRSRGRGGSQGRGGARGGMGGSTSGKRGDRGFELAKAVCHLLCSRMRQTSCASHAVVFTPALPFDGTATTYA